MVDTKGPEVYASPRITQNVIISFNIYAKPT